MVCCDVMTYAVNVHIAIMFSINKSDYHSSIIWILARADRYALNSRSHVPTRLHCIASQRARPTYTTTNINTNTNTQTFHKPHST